MTSQQHASDQKRLSSIESLFQNTKKNIILPSSKLFITTISKICTLLEAASRAAAAAAAASSSSSTSLGGGGTAK